MRLLVCGTFVSFILLLTLLGIRENIHKNLSVRINNDNNKVYT